MECPKCKSKLKIIKGLLRCYSCKIIFTSKNPDKLNPKKLKLVSSEDWNCPPPKGFLISDIPY